MFNFSRELRGCNIFRPPQLRDWCVDTLVLSQSRALTYYIHWCLINIRSIYLYKYSYKTSMITPCLHGRVVQFRRVNMMSGGRGHKNLPTATPLRKMSQNIFMIILSSWLLVAKLTFSMLKMPFSGIQEVENVTLSAATRP